MIRYKLCGVDIASELFELHLLRGKVWFVMEHTGGYEQGLALAMLELGHRVSLVDGLAVSRYRAFVGKKAKTDKMDAELLARFGRERRPCFWTPRPSAYRELLELTRHRQDLVAAITAWHNRRGAPKESAFVHAQQETLLSVLKLQKDELEAQMRRLIASHEQIAASIELMRSVKGVQWLTAACFLAEAGPVSAYPTPESLALAAGLAPLACQSGKSQGTYRLPYGNERLRNCLTMAASVARRHNPALSLFASRIQAKGGKSPALLNRAVKRKLCHIFWGILKNQEPFDPAKAVKNFT